jgi:hypothetical protein
MTASSCFVIALDDADRAFEERPGVRGARCRIVEQ